MPHDWRPPPPADWQRLRTLLRGVRIHLEGAVEQTEQDRALYEAGSYQRQAELDDHGICRLLTPLAAQGLIPHNRAQPNLNGVSIIFKP
jgi:hypothetical protein